MTGDKAAHDAAMWAIWGGVVLGVLVVIAALVWLGSWWKNRRDVALVEGLGMLQDADAAESVPAWRSIEEIALDGARPIDELAALIEAWNAIDYRVCDLVADKADSLRGKEIEVHLADGGDTMLDRALSRLERDGRAAVEYLRVAAHARGETWAGQAWTREDWLIAEHGYERPADLRLKASRPADVDETREMTPAERRALKLRLSRKAARR